MFINYVVRHPKQFRYIKLIKKHSEKVHRYERKSLSLLQSDYNQSTIELQLVTSSFTSWKQTVQAVPSKKKRKKKEGKGERENERKEKERKKVEKRRREKRDGKSLCGKKEKGEKEMWKKR